MPRPAVDVRDDDVQASLTRIDDRGGCILALNAAPPADAPIKRVFTAVLDEDQALAIATDILDALGFEKEEARR